jgi:cytochrome c oxidase assembly factor CtaG
MFNGLSSTASWSLGITLVLVAFCALYLVMLCLAFVRAKRTSVERPVSVVRIVAFFLGILLVAVLLLSPINTIARTQLFSMHMAQAVALTTVCAPLIIAGWPASMLRPVDETPILRTIVHFLLLPLVASVLFNVTFLVWHAPLVYGAVMKSSMLYHIMLLSIFFAAILNWWPLIGSQHERRKLSLPMQMLYAFFDGQPVDIFAFVLVFSGVAIYPLYVIPSQLHLSPFGDQTVAGALLLIPGLVDLGVMSPLFVRWLGQLELRTQQEDLRREREREMAEEDDEDESELNIDRGTETDAGHGPLLSTCAPELPRP